MDPHNAAQVDRRLLSPTSVLLLQVFTVMLNFAVVSVTAVGASLVSLTSAAAPVGQSESGSLVIFGLGLLVLSVAARRAGERS